MDEDKKYQESEGNGGENPRPDAPSFQNPTGQNPVGQNPTGQNPNPYAYSAGQQSSYGSYGSGGYYNPAPQEPKKPKKPKYLGLIVVLVVLYLGLVGGIFALVYSGAIDLDSPPETETRGEAEEGEKKTEEKKENAPIQENGTGEGGGIVADGYTGEPLSAAQLYEANADCVVFVEATYRQGKSTGSGFVIDSENGYILTNHHVVKDASEVAVTFKNSDSYVAKIIGGDEINDVAVLKVEAKDLKHVTIGDSDKIRVGEDILVIGNPLGDLTFTLTRGIVSAVNRSINTGEYNIHTFQTDAAINSGNSGGPAFDASGAVIGIASAKYAASGVEGIGFCIPINDAMAIARDLVDHGYVTGRPNFGIAVSDSQGYEYTTDEFGRRVLVETTKGAKVEEVGKGSCAEKAGLQVGDVITKLGKKSVTNATQLINEKNSYKAGDTVTLEVYRKGETLTLTVTLDEYTPES